MPLLRIANLPVRYDAPVEATLTRLLTERLGPAWSRVRSFRIVRRSIDARRGPVRLVHVVEVDFDGELSEVEGARLAPAPVTISLEPGTWPLVHPPVVVGAGPAGLLGAWLLAREGYRPLLLERGGTAGERQERLRGFARDRRPDPECNALFGIGGAGTFSDGKLATSVNHPWIEVILELLVRHGAPSRILVDAKPHVGTDLLAGVVTGLAAEIEAQGGTVRTGVRVDGLVLRGGRVAGLSTSSGTVPAEAVLVATGHSARDTWSCLAAGGVPLVPKPFQLGLRVDHPQAWLDRLQYGPAAGHPALGAADYKLSTRVGPVPVFSFCMCPGGETMPTVNEPEHLAINGMSGSRRDSAFASSGLVVTLAPEDFGGRDRESCLGFVRHLEQAAFRAGGGDYAAPAQRLVDFARGVASARLPASSYALGIRPARLDELLPAFVAGPLRRALGDFDETLAGYLHPEAVAHGVESRASSPLRIPRDPRTGLATGPDGIYPAGEGAGWAGGITSAALDGLLAAAKIVARHQRPG